MTSALLGFSLDATEIVYNPATGTFRVYRDMDAPAEEWDREFGFADFDLLVAWYKGLPRPATSKPPEGPA